MAGMAGIAGSGFAGVGWEEAVEAAATELGLLAAVVAETEDLVNTEDATLP